MDAGRWEVADVSVFYTAAPVSASWSFTINGSIVSQFKIHLYYTNENVSIYKMEGFFLS